MTWTSITPFLLCGSAKAEVAIQVDSERFGVGRDTFCGASSLWGVGVDSQGNLYQCWEVVDKPQFSFGTAHDWDPLDPLATATRPDLLTCYVNSGAPLDDSECRACIWLPMCVGGCPHERLFGEGRQCVPYRDDPESFVRAVYAHTDLG